jgi:eukaryotic-like serine/threonine-protein kinase
MMQARKALEDDPLDDIAAAISDGQPIPWESVHASGTHPADPVLREFQVLAALADLHRRSQTIDESAGEHAALEPRASWGPFSIHAVLGRGTFGTVYRARDPKLDRDVALKLVPTSGAAGVDRVVAEGRRLARVRHPNVITVFGADVFDGVAGIWMELLEGETLHQELNERGPLGAREAALVGIDLCQALAAVHHALLVHRDVKPQNVMRQEGGRIVLMDFGTGRDLATPGAQAGTPLYMAPELLAGDNASVASDIYSLGVLLFHLVTGDFPVSGADFEHLRDAHRSGRRRRLRDVRPDLPSSFIKAVEQATATNPAERPSSAAAFEQSLEAVLQRDGADRGLKHRAWRSPMTMIATFLATLTLVVFSIPGVRNTFAPEPGRIQSLAVLPFANATGSAEQDYLADSVTTLLIDQLAQLDSLRVISRTSSMAYKGTNKSLATIASELRIDGIVEGSVARFGDRIRVTVRLMRSNDTRVWTQTYEPPSGDLLKVEGEIASTVADAVKLSLTDEERNVLHNTPAVAVQAQDAFLRGLHRLNDLRGENLRQALADLTEAVRLDPSSARAFAALSQCYVLLASTDVLSHAEAYRNALSAANRAIYLDDRVAEAHTQLAEVKFYDEWNWDWAQREYERALQLNPNNSHALARHSLFLSALGKADEAIRLATLAQDRDPASTTIRFAPGMALYYARRYDEAIAAFQHLTEIPPYALLPPDRVGLARALSAVGRHGEAIAELEAAIKQQGARTPWVAEMGRIHAMAGNLDQARKILGELRQTQGVSGGRPANLAFLSIAVGDLTSAFEELERAVQQRSPVMLWANVDPRFDPIRNDPRFRDLLVRIGFPVNR